MKRFLNYPHSKKDMAKVKKHKKPTHIRTKKKSIWNPALVLTLLITLVMITSIIGFVYEPESSFITDMNLSFEVGEDRKVIIEDMDNSPRFRFLPSQVSDLEIDAESEAIIKSTPMMYVTFDPRLGDKEDLELARFELSTEFLKYFNKYISSGITTEDPMYSLPLITCENATQSVPVIFFSKGNETSVSSESNCVTFNAKSGTEFLRIKDRLLYLMLDII